MLPAELGKRRKNWSSQTVMLLGNSPLLPMDRNSIAVTEKAKLLGVIIDQQSDLERSCRGVSEKCWTEAVLFNPVKTCASKNSGPCSLQLRMRAFINRLCVCSFSFLIATVLTNISLKGSQKRSLFTIYAETSLC